MKRISSTAAILSALLFTFMAPGQDKPVAAVAPYQSWLHSGSLYLLTTPEGANLPATASVEGFPALVRLHMDWFDFKQAKAGGEDLRFSTSTGAPLPYQIEEWDVVSGTASIWVRVPLIKGNERQEIKVHWGKRTRPTSRAAVRCSTSRTAT